MESTSQYDSLRSFPGQSISSQHAKRRTRDSIPTYKVLMIGNVDVGKTCLLMRLCEDRFPREKKEYTLGKCKELMGVPKNLVCRLRQHGGYFRL